MRNYLLARRLLVLGLSFMALTGLVLSPYANASRRVVVAKILDQKNGKIAVVGKAKVLDADITKGVKVQIDILESTTQVASAMGEVTPANPVWEEKVGDQVLKIVMEAYDPDGDDGKVIGTLRRGNLDNPTAQYSVSVYMSQLPSTPIFTGTDTVEFS